jgi:PIN domain nuclease of toxin-antitoxin system
MLNLDTHILVYALNGDLTAAEKRLLSRQPWSISAIVVWELAKLAGAGRITLDIDSPEFARTLARIHIWPLDLAVCRAIGSLDFRSDPADEIIAATSIVHRVPLVTRDRRIRQSKKTPLAVA